MGLGRRTSRARRIGIAGLVALMVGGVLLGTAVVASASPPTSGSSGCTGTCSVTPVPDSGLAFASSMIVNGSGFTPKSDGAVVECNLTPGEPTVAIPDNKAVKIKNFGSLQVGCSSPYDDAVRVASDGSVFAGFGVNTGTVGPPALGTDTGGGSALTDAASYPCPPTQAQVAAGYSCAMVFQDAAAENAWEDITFTTPYTTTTTTAAPATTLVACNGVPKSASAVNAGTGTTATVTVTNATCLVGGQTVQVTATNLSPSSIGSVLECNADKSQPTVLVVGTAIPISCSKLDIFTTTSSGGVPTGNQAFTVLESSSTETIGGQNSGPETGGTGNLAADAAKYPCPPTPAQVTAGDFCVIAVGDTGNPKIPNSGDQVAVPISFNTAVPPPTGPQGGTTTTPKSGTKAKTVTKAKSGSLAFTGAGTGLWLLATLGVLLMVLGGFALAVVEGPRRMLHVAFDHGRRRRPDTE